MGSEIDDARAEQMDEQLRRGIAAAASRCTPEGCHDRLCPYCNPQPIDLEEAVEQEKEEERDFLEEAFRIAEGKTRLLAQRQHVQALVTALRRAQEESQRMPAIREAVLVTDGLLRTTATLVEELGERELAGLLRQAALSMFAAVTPTTAGQATVAAESSELALTGQEVV